MAAAEPVAEPLPISRQWLRYLLDQLNEDPDGPGRFEQLATSLVHRRKAANIIPATPPSYGGDLGVDSRTAPVLLDSESLFRLYQSPPEAGHNWIFAYSIRKDWEVKLRADIETILQNGLKPERVVFVTSRRISPERVKIEAEQSLKEEFGIEVEILDGAWIELHLQGDDYALAVRYLGAHPINDPELRAFAERVFGLKRGGLDESEALEVERLRRELQYQSKYTTIPAHFFRDVGSLAGLLTEYEETFAEGIGWYREAWARVDATRPEPVMGTAYGYLRALHRDPALHEEMLVGTCRYVDMAIQTNIPYFGREAASLLQFLMPHFASDARWLGARSRLREWADRAGERPYGAVSVAYAADTVLALDFPTKGSSTEAIDAYLERVRAHLVKFRRAHPCRLEHWGEILAMAAPVFGGKPNYEALYDYATEIVAERAGAMAAASIHRDRAVAYAKVSRWVEAFRAAAKAQKGWMNEEALRGFLISTLFMAECASKEGRHWVERMALGKALHVITNEPTQAHWDLLPRVFIAFTSNALGLGRYLEASKWLRMYPRACEMARVEVSTETIQSGLLLLLLVSRGAGALHEELRRRADEMMPFTVQFYEDLVLASDAAFEDWLADDSLDDATRAKARDLRTTCRSHENKQPTTDELGPQAQGGTTWQHVLGTTDVRLDYPNDSVARALAGEVLGTLELWLMLSAASDLCVVDEELRLVLGMFSEERDIDARSQGNGVLNVTFNRAKLEAMQRGLSGDSLVRAIAVVACLAREATLDAVAFIDEMFKDQFKEVFESLTIVAPPGFVEAGAIRILLDERDSA